MHPVVPYLDLPAQNRALRSDIDAAIRRVIDSSAFCLGPEVDAFETEFAAFHEAKHAVEIGRAHV